MTPESIRQFRAVVADHKFREEFVEHLEDAAPALQTADVEAKLALIGEFLQTHVLEHFALEEKVVFPQLAEAATDPATRSLLAELTAEHAGLLAGVRDLNDLLTQSSPIDTAATQRTELAFRSFLGELQRHAAKEDRLLVPVIERFDRQYAKTD